MPWRNSTWILLFLFGSLIHYSSARGVLTIWLLNYKNAKGRTYDGSCCDYAPTGSDTCPDHCDYVMRCIVTGLGRANDHVFLFHRPIKYDSNDISFEGESSQMTQLTILFDEWPAAGSVKMDVFFYDYDDFDHTTVLVDWFETPLRQTVKKGEKQLEAVRGNRQMDKTRLEFKWSVHCFGSNDCLKPPPEWNVWPWAAETGTRARPEMSSLLIDETTKYLPNYSDSNSFTTWSPHYKQTTIRVFNKSKSGEWENDDGADNNVWYRKSPYHPLHQDKEGDETFLDAREHARIIDAEERLVILPSRATKRKYKSREFGNDAKQNDEYAKNINLGEARNPFHKPADAHVVRDKLLNNIYKKIALELPQNNSESYVTFNPPDIDPYPIPSSVGDKRRIQTIIAETEINAGAVPMPKNPYIDSNGEHIKLPGRKPDARKPTTDDTDFMSNRIHSPDNSQMNESPFNENVNSVASGKNNKSTFRKIGIRPNPTTRKWDENYDWNRHYKDYVLPRKHIPKVKTHTIVWTQSPPNGGDRSKSRQQISNTGAKRYPESSLNLLKEARKNEPIDVGHYRQIHTDFISEHNRKRKLISGSEYAHNAIEQGTSASSNHENSFTHQSRHQSTDMFSVQSTKAPVTTNNNVWKDRDLSRDNKRVTMNDNNLEYNEVVKVRYPAKKQKSVVTPRYQVNKKHDKNIGVTSTGRHNKKDKNSNVNHRNLGRSNQRKSGNTKQSTVNVLKAFRENNKSSYTIETIVPGFIKKGNKHTTKTSLNIFGNNFIIPAVTVPSPQNNYRVTKASMSTGNNKIVHKPIQIKTFGKPIVTSVRSTNNVQYNTKRKLERTKRPHRTSTKYVTSTTVNPFINSLPKPKTRENLSSVKPKKNQSNHYKKRVNSSKNNVKKDKVKEPSPKRSTSSKIMKPPISTVTTASKAGSKSKTDKEESSKRSKSGTFLKPYVSTKSSGNQKGKEQSSKWTTSSNIIKPQITTFLTTMGNKNKNSKVQSSKRNTASVIFKTPKSLSPTATRAGNKNINNLLLPPHKTGVIESGPQIPDGIDTNKFTKHSSVNAMLTPIPGMGTTTMSRTSVVHGRVINKNNKIVDTKHVYIDPGGKPFGKNTADRSRAVTKPTIIIFTPNTKSPLAKTFHHLTNIMGIVSRKHVQPTDITKIQKKPSYRKKTANPPHQQEYTTIHKKVKLITEVTTPRLWVRHSAKSLPPTKLKVLIGNQNKAGKVTKTYNQRRTTNQRRYHTTAIPAISYLKTASPVISNPKGSKATTTDSEMNIFEFLPNAIKDIYFGKTKEPNNKSKTQKKQKNHNNSIEKGVPVNKVTGKSVTSNPVKQKKQNGITKGLAYSKNQEEEHLNYIYRQPISDGKSNFLFQEKNFPSAKSTRRSRIQQSHTTGFNVRPTRRHIPSQQQTNKPPVHKQPIPITIPRPPRPKIATHGYFAYTRKDGQQVTKKTSTTVWFKSKNKLTTKKPAERRKSSTTKHKNTNKKQYNNIRLTTITKLSNKHHMQTTKGHRSPNSVASNTPKPSVTKDKLAKTPAKKSKNFLDIETKPNKKNKVQKNSKAVTSPKGVTKDTKHTTSSKNKTATDVFKWIYDLSKPLPEKEDNIVKKVDQDVLIDNTNADKNDNTRSKNGKEAAKNKANEMFNIREADGVTKKSQSKNKHDDFSSSKTNLVSTPNNNVTIPIKDKSTGLKTKQLTTDAMTTVDKSMLYWSSIPKITKRRKKPLKTTHMLSTGKTTSTPKLKDNTKTIEHTLTTISETPPTTDTESTTLTAPKKVKLTLPPWLKITDPTTTSKPTRLPSTKKKINKTKTTTKKLTTKVKITTKPTTKKKLQTTTKQPPKKQKPVKISKPVNVTINRDPSANGGPRIIVPNGGLYIPQPRDYNSSYGLSGSSEARNLRLQVRKMNLKTVFNRYWPAILGLTVGTVFLVAAVLTSVACRQQRLYIRRSGWTDIPHHVSEPPDTSEYSSAASLVSDATRSSISFP